MVLVAGALYAIMAYWPRGSSSVAFDPDLVRTASDSREVDTLVLERGALAGGNVLLVTLDTTRADRLGCYGNEDIQTPTLDRLAREGVVFSQAVAASPTTLPSHASILTGLYACHHGARVNGLYRLGDSHKTLAEVLAENGYTTGALISAYVLDSCFGLDQGFQHYDDDLSDGEEPPLFGYEERKADKTTERAIRWLRGVAGKPFFLWVHYFDPHAVYQPPSPYAEQYRNSPYDGEIAFVDAEFGRLIDTVEELGLSDRTLVVVVGDHGESLGQHSELTHGYLLYESSLRVPLIMRCGQRLGNGVHVRRRVSHVDLMPTILSLLGLDPPQRHDGVDLTVREQQPCPIQAETLYSLLFHGWAALLAVYDGPYKYIHGPVPELYDISQDPHESTNLAESRPELAATLRETLAGLFGPDLDVTAVAQPTKTLSMAELTKLQALGYVGTAANIPPPASRPNPKDMMPTLNLVDGVVRTPDPSLTIPDKIERLEQIVEAHPDFHPAWRYLGDLCRLAGRAARAEEAYQRCVELCPDPTTLWGLALTKGRQGKTRAAEALFREIVSRYPDYLNARHALGVLAGQARRYDEAVKHFERVLDLDPDFVQDGMQPCAAELVQTYLAAGRADELPGVLQPRLEANPRSVNLRGALATYYLSQRQYAKAEALLRAGVALMPDDRATIGNLALFLVTSPDPQTRRLREGYALMERLCEKSAYSDPESLKLLSGLYTVGGRLAEAAAIAEKAKDLATQAGKHSLAEELAELLEKLEKAMKAGRAPAPSPPGGDD